LEYKINVVSSTPRLTFLLERELKAIFTKVFIILLWGREGASYFYAGFHIILEQE
jgi:hypothetical protein